MKNNRGQDPEGEEFDDEFDDEFELLDDQGRPQRSVNGAAFDPEVDLYSFPGKKEDFSEENEDFSDENDTTPPVNG
jgi:hypothetical protein